VPWFSCTTFNCGPGVPAFNASIVTSVDDEGDHDNDAVGADELLVLQQV
jgi:hypothetical protein